MDDMRRSVASHDDALRRGPESQSGESNEEGWLLEGSEPDEIALPEGENAALSMEETDPWKDKYLRLHAELDNTKKRIAKRFEVELEEETRSMLLDLLPVADNLERIIAYARELEDQELERGLKITLESFRAAMKKHNVTPMNALGARFDPRYHDAVSTVSTDRYDEGTVLKVEQTGYFKGDKVLRPARVIVAA